MGSAWEFGGESAPVAPGSITVLAGSTFALSTSSGDIHPSEAGGFFFRDTRHISQWILLVDDQPPEPLATLREKPFRTRFLARAMLGDTRALVERERTVDQGLRDKLVVRNLGTGPGKARLTLHFGADFANLFEVKERRVTGHGDTKASTRDDGTSLSDPATAGTEHSQGVLVQAAGAGYADDHLTFDLDLAAGETWQTEIHAIPMAGDKPLRPDELVDPPGMPSRAERRLNHWQDSTAEVTSGNTGFAHTLERSRADLGALRIFDPGHPDTPVVAAGSPWFMTLFGRDSILTSYMAMAMAPDLGGGVLKTLARHQGTRTVDVTEEQPGRILHEVRFSDSATLHLGGRHIYYGSVDATPLFVVLLGEYARWHGLDDDVRHLLPAADAALGWITDSGDRDGDGFVEYERLTDDGLANQGWKDSWDGISFADGRLPEPPIALVEVQGYAYAAYRARARLARALGDEDGAQRWDRRAAELKDAFNEAFWLPDRGWYALGLDGDKKPIDALASNMGQALATGIVDRRRAPAVAARLMSDEMFSGWGIRTLATNMGRYDPLSYHNGSVWPHDNALIAYGLMRCGFVEEAQRVALGILSVAHAFDGRLPELFCGLDRTDYPQPVPYPTSCSPQAWAAAAPVHLARLMLGLEPDLLDGVVHLDPKVPSDLHSVEVTGLPLDGERVHVSAVAGWSETGDLPEGLTWRRSR